MAQPLALQHSLKWPVAFLFIILYGIGLWTTFHWQSTISRFEDVATQVNGGQRILHGEVLYRDIFSPALPIFFYMRVPGVWIAEHSGTSVMAVATVFDNIMAMISLVLTLRIFARLSNFGPLSFHAIGWIMAAITFLLPYHDNVMGQHEFFLWVCTIPYFTLSAATVEGYSFSRTFRAIIGVFAALGFCYKPVFIVPLLLTEAYLCLSAANWRLLLRAEFMTCTVSGIAYVVLLMLAFPIGLSDIVYLARLHYEWHFDFITIAFYYSRKFFQFLSPAAVLWAYVTWARMPMYRFMHVYFFVLFGYAISAMVQLKADGFDYHLFPTFAMSLFTVSVMVCLMKSQPVGRNRNIVLLLSSAILAYFAWYSSTIVLGGVENSLTEQQARRMMLDHLGEVQKSHPSVGNGVFKFGTLLNPVFPEGFAERGIPYDYHLYDHELLWGINFYKVHHRYEPEAQVYSYTKKAEMMMQTLMTQDIERLKPGIILQPENKIDYIAYYSSYPPFLEQMKHYNLLEHFDGYEVYIRQP